METIRMLYRFDIDTPIWVARIEGQNFKLRHDIWGRKDYIWKIEQGIWCFESAQEYEKCRECLNPIKEVRIHLKRYPFTGLN